MMFLADLWRYAIVLNLAALALCLTLQQLMAQWPDMLAMIADLSRVLS